MARNHALLLISVVITLFRIECGGFTCTRSVRIPVSVATIPNLRDAEMMEMLIGGRRYELVPLPDSMLDTTIFVGNLNEFAKDEDLSRTFQSVTTLQSVPACVQRRPNNQSLEYGFVVFPTVEETQAAIVRFHGVEFMGRRLRVQPIIDDRRKGRVRVPEWLVTYVLGDAKKTPKRKKNDLSMRRISPRLQNNNSKSNKNHDDKSYKSNNHRPKRDRKRETRRRRRSTRSDYEDNFF